MKSVEKAIRGYRNRLIRERDQAFFRSKSVSVPAEGTLKAVESLVYGRCLCELEKAMIECGMSVR